MAQTHGRPAQKQQKAQEAGLHLNKSSPAGFKLRLTDLSNRKFPPGTLGQTLQATIFSLSGKLLSTQREKEESQKMRKKVCFSQIVVNFQ